MKLSNESRWFLSVAEAHPDFHIEHTSTMIYAKIFLQPGKTKVVGRFFKLDGHGVVL